MTIKREWLKDLRPVEAIIYAYLMENPTKWKQEKMAEELNIARPTLSKAIYDLEKKGYILIKRFGLGSKAPKRYILLKD